MLISPKHSLIFVHIPKNAGTSIRHQLRDTDPDHIFMGKPQDHPELGRIDYAHIPLHRLRTHFPDEYAHFADCDSFAMVRNPLDRFGSALRQMLWQYEERPMTLIPADELRGLTLRMLDDIAGEVDDPSYKFIFFTRQADYIFDQGKQVISHLIPIDLSAELLDYFSARTGVQLDRDRRSNQNVELKVKGRFGAMAYRANAALRKALPPSLHGALKGAALKALAKEGSAAEASGILDIPEVQQFVTEHYARDQEIFDQVMARREEIRAGLAAGQL